MGHVNFRSARGLLPPEGIRPQTHTHTRHPPSPLTHTNTHTQTHTHLRLRIHVYILAYAYTPVHPHTHKTAAQTHYAFCSSCPRHCSATNVDIDLSALHIRIHACLHLRYTSRRPHVYTCPHRCMCMRAPAKRAQVRMQRYASKAQVRLQSVHTCVRVCLHRYACRACTHSSTGARLRACAASAAMRAATRGSRAPGLATPGGTGTRRAPCPA